MKRIYALLQMTIDKKKDDRRQNKNKHKLHIMDKKFKEKHKQTHKTLKLLQNQTVKIKQTNKTWDGANPWDNKNQDGEDPYDSRQKKIQETTVKNVLLEEYQEWPNDICDKYL